MILRNASDASGDESEFRNRKKKDRHVVLGIYAKDVPSTVRPGTVFFREAGVAVEVHEPSSLVVLIAVSPYWYIRGATPNRRIRRWRSERAPCFSKALRHGDTEAFSARLPLRRREVGLP